MKKFLLLAMLGLLTACSPSALIEKIANPEKTKIARDYVQRLMDGDATLLAEIEPKLRTGNEVEALQTVRALIPPGAPVSTDLVGYNFSRFNSESNYNVTFQFSYGDRWLLATVGWREKPDQPREITRISVTPLEGSLQEINAFTFKRAAALHFIFLAGLIIIPVFSIVTLVVCIRTKFPRRKWLWIIFVIIGFCTFSLNWTTGQTSMNPLAFQLFGAGAMTSGVYAPWIISISVPVGAIAFWFKRRRLLQAPPLIPPVLPQLPGEPKS